MPPELTRLNSPASRRPALALLAALSLVLPCAASAPSRAAEAADPHAHHKQQLRTMKRARRSTAEIRVPQVTLQRDDGKSVSLAEELDDGRPLAVNFVFTTCGSICPLMSQIFSQLQDKLGVQSAKVHLVSISIDPEQDTPERLSAYAKKFHAGPQWQHYTGATEACVAAQRAFDVFRGDKMNHTPVTFLRAAPGQPWVRIDGFASSDELLREVRDMVAAR